MKVLILYSIILILLVTTTVSQGRCNHSRQFSSVNELHDTIMKSANITLFQIRASGGNGYKAQALIASLNVSVQFQWPFPADGLVSLEPNRIYTLPDFNIFKSQLFSQLGVSFPFPITNAVGIGNYGFSLTALEFRFCAKSLENIRFVLNIPGWDVLRFFHLRILHPQLVITIHQMQQKLLMVKAVGELVGMSDYAETLPVNFHLPNSTIDPLKIVTQNSSTTIPYSHLHKFLTVSQKLKMPTFTSRVFEQILVKNLEILLLPGMQQISRLILNTTSPKPWKIGNLALHNITLNVYQSVVDVSSFVTLSNLGNQRLSLSQNQMNSLELANQLETTHFEEMLKELRKQTLANSTASIPNFKSVNLFHQSKMKVKLTNFTIKIYEAPQTITDIFLFVKLPRDWDAFGKSSLVTLGNSSFSLAITSLGGRPVVKAIIDGSVKVGNPTFLEHLFHMEIPHKAQSITVNLQPGKVFKVGFDSILKIGGFLGLPDVLKELLHKTNVSISGLSLMFPSQNNTNPTISAFKLESNNVWNLTFIKLTKPYVEYKKNRYTITGQLEFLGMKSQAYANLSPDEKPVIVAQSLLKLKDLTSFCSRISKHFINQNFELDLAGVGLRNIEEFAIKLINFTLSDDLRTIKTGDIHISYSKYSWNLFQEYFDVKSVTSSISIDVGKTISMIIKGDINLLAGNLKIPFQMKVPTLSSNDISIRGFISNEGADVQKLQDLVILFQTITNANFPTVLCNAISEIRIIHFVVSFTKHASEMDKVTFLGKIASPWDLGNRGLLHFNDLAINVTRSTYDVYGNVSIGGIDRAMKFIEENGFDGPKFQQLAPLTTSNLATFITNLFQQLLPEIFDIPDGKVIGLETAVFQIIEADIEFSRDLNSIITVNLEAIIKEKWEFFSNYFHLKKPYFKFKVTYLSEVQSDYEFSISGFMDLCQKNGQILEVPLFLSMPSFPSDVATLKLRSPININMSDIMSIPIVDKTITDDLISPISELIGPVTVNDFSSDFKRDGNFSKVQSIFLSATAMQTWRIPSLPFRLYNLTLKIWYSPVQRKALLSGITMIKNYPIHFEMPFPADQGKVHIKFKFKGITDDDSLDFTLTDLAGKFVPRVDFSTIFPDSFFGIGMKVRQFRIRLETPLTSLNPMAGFTTELFFNNRIELMKGWLSLSDVTVRLDVSYDQGLTSHGELDCLVQFGSIENGIIVRSTITFQSPLTREWSLRISPDVFTPLTLATAASLFLDGLDIKSLFPTKMFARVADVKLTDLEVAFVLKPKARVNRVRCVLETSLQDVWLPLQISIKSVHLDIEIIYQETEPKRVITSQVQVWIDIGQATLQTVLSIRDDSYHLQTFNAGYQALTIFDLASLVGGSELLRVIPKPFMRFKETSFNRLELIFSKTFKLQDVFLTIDLHGFDVGFQIPLLGPDYVLHAELKVSTLDIERLQGKPWVFKARLAATISGIAGDIDASLRNLDGVLTISPGTAPTILINRKLLSINMKTSIAGTELKLNIEITNPKLVYQENNSPEFTADLTVNGFSGLNVFLPFNLFENQLTMALVLSPPSSGRKSPIGLQLTKLPIRKYILPCEDIGLAEYKCDFTWLCSPDSYVYIKSPYLSYTTEGFEFNIDIKGIEKLCIPTSPTFLRDFIEKIPLLRRIFKKNIPIWPPPNIKRVLRKFGFNINNLPRGMDRFLNPVFPERIIASATVGHGGPLSMSIKVPKGEPLTVCNMFSIPHMTGVILREFTIGMAHGIPFAIVDAEVYIWNLLFLMPLSHLPKQNPLIIDAQDLETHFICKDCYFIIVGSIPVPIFASPLHLRYTTILDANAHFTLYHKRPGLNELGSVVRFLSGLMKFFRKSDYLLSLSDFGSYNSSKDFLVIRFHHNNLETFLQLPKVMGRIQLKLDVGEIDGKRFLIGFMNFFKTLDSKWLLYSVPLQHRIKQANSGIGGFPLKLVSFAASSPDELRANKTLWKHPVPGFGNETMLVASLNTSFASLDLQLKAISLINSDLNFTFSVGVTEVIRLELGARSYINLKDMANPLLFRAGCVLYLINAKLLTGEALVSARGISISGELDFDFFDLLKIRGKTKAKFLLGQFFLSSKVGVEFIGLKLFDGYLRIRSGLLISEVKATSSFMGSQLTIHLLRNITSLRMEAQALIDIGVDINLGEIHVFGVDLGTFQLTTGVLVDLKISFPGKSHLNASFYFQEERFSTPTLEFDTTNVRPDKITRMVKDLVQSSAVKAIIESFKKYPQKYLKALVQGMLKVGKEVARIVKQFLKAGLGIAKNVAKQAGEFLNKFARYLKDLADKAAKHKRFIAQLAQAARKFAKRALKAAKVILQNAKILVEKVGRELKGAIDDFKNALSKRLRLESLVKQIRLVISTIGKEILKIIRIIIQIAKELLEEISNGIRNAYGRITKFLGSIGKRSIHRRILENRKKYYERKKRELEVMQSNVKTKLRSFERDLLNAQRIESLKNSKKKLVQRKLKAAETSLDTAIKDEVDKYDVVADIENKGKCVTGENDCHPEAQCLRTGDDGQSFECVCKRGWKGDGHNCEQVIKQVSIIADNAVAVGEVVTFAAYPQGGTNVEYKFSFNDSYSSSAFQSHVFNSSGVYKVNVYAQNSVSNVVGETEVIVQEAVSNITLLVEGQKGACRPLSFLVSSAGTDITHDLDFGDNATIQNTTQKVFHYYQESGEYTITVTGRNLVSKLTKTFTVSILRTQCDKLYCDIKQLERVDTPLLGVARQAWELAKSSRDTILYPDPEVWNVLSVIDYNLPPLNGRVFNTRRVYSISGHDVDTAYVYASISSLGMENTFKHIPGPTSNIAESILGNLLISALSVYKLDLVNSWKISKETYCNQTILQPARLNGIIDGYILGKLVANNDTWKLSDLISSYYCPMSNYTRPLPVNVQQRYSTFVDMLRKNNVNGTLSDYLNRLASGFPIEPKRDKSSFITNGCIGSFLEYLSHILNISTGRQDPCFSWKSCGMCLSAGANDNCVWCEKSSKCTHQKDNSTCSFPNQRAKLPCPDRCSKLSNCQDCKDVSSCGWCGAPSLGRCVEGDTSGPLDAGVCGKSSWHFGHLGHFGQCPGNCYSNNSFPCDGHGQCISNKCNCDIGYYGSNCANKGCVYRVGFKDTIYSIARKFDIKISLIKAVNNDGGGVFNVSANMLLTIPVKDTDLCLNHPNRERFHQKFPKLLRGSKNIVGKSTYCGLYGSVSTGKSMSHCRKLNKRDACQSSLLCTWNPLDPCTGTFLKGCFQLSNTTQILILGVDNSIVSPISGKILIGKDFATVSGWPYSEWEDFIVTISRVKPLNITSAQAGDVLGVASMLSGPILPTFIEVSVSYKRESRNPEEYLLKCAPGCSYYDLDNGICDSNCNVSSCNYDYMDCLSQQVFRENLNLPLKSMHSVITDQSWSVLFKLYKMTRENITVKNGPMSVFGLAQSIATHFKHSSLLTRLIYDTSPCKEILLNHLKLQLAENKSDHEITVSVGKILMESNNLEISPHLSQNDVQSFDISIAQLVDPVAFEEALQFLKEVRLLTYLMVNTSDYSTAHFHIEVRQHLNSKPFARYQYHPSQSPSCNAIYSCYGHGVCNTRGECVCDEDYYGIDCRTSKCLNNCSGHGYCIENTCVCEHGWGGKDCSTLKRCTPLCLDVWIGDGICDPNCNISRCNYDGNDCLGVCACSRTWLGDGICDHSCNTQECNYDNGDCVYSEECSLGCISNMLGDGFCDRECNFKSCSFDDGDCPSHGTCMCDLSLQGNGICDEECNNKECMFDFGDCILHENLKPDCFKDKGCSPSMIANNYCDLACNISSCNFDGEDCINTIHDIQSPCSPGCVSTFLNDSHCDSVCNVKACNFDKGDCPLIETDMCSPGCLLNMTGDGKCQKECFVSQCGYDGSDCECSPGCTNDLLGNGFCDPKCWTEPCSYDKNDCTCSPERCPRTMIGNGICDQTCNNAMCDFDGGDCQCALGCPLNIINDGWCDEKCNTKECNFDGLDCGDCDGQSHASMCDPNAECFMVANGSLPFLRCRCQDGYHGNGFHCIKEGNCFSNANICSSDAQCVNTNGTFECMCKLGFTGNGLYCENIDECVTNQHNCSMNAVCTDTRGDYSCACVPGYSGDGFICDDINECNDTTHPHQCCFNEKCLNTDGSYNCECQDGWRSKNDVKIQSHPLECNSSVLIRLSCTDIDECLEEIDNCSRVNGHRNAQCLNNPGGFTCSCNPGWVGDGWYCTDEDECDQDNVCDENQICKNTFGSYSCLCKDGWIFNGTGVETCSDINECVLGIDKCSEYAACTNTNGSYSCDCREGFEDIGRVCTSYSCKNLSSFENSTFYNLSLHYLSQDSEDEFCTCIGAYNNTGRQCVDIDECKWETFNCPPDAPVCINTLGSYECQCDSVGNSTCQTFNPCRDSNITCHPNKTCVASGLKHYCKCPMGYNEDPNGPGCIDRDECLDPETFPCPENGICVNTIGSFHCKCQEGYFEHGGTCFEVNECDGTLVDQISGRLLECQPGICSSVQTCLYYRGLENNSSNMSLVCSCDKDNSRELSCVESYLAIKTDETNMTTTVLSFPWKMMFNSSNSSSLVPSIFRNNCSEPGSSCFNTPGAYKCICNPGFYSDKDEQNCHDENECLNSNTCHPNATCTNTVGSYICACRAGFLGDGQKNCSDVNECEEETYTCHSNATCINVIGGYFCQCNKGFSGNGSFCDDIDECSNTTLNQCHIKAMCSNSVGGYTCKCSAGYEGDGIRCNDINECLNGSNICSKHATCSNLPGTYTCNCNNGYTGDGYNCTNVNECLLGTHTCVENSYCNDTEGGYNCTCDRGWVRQSFEPYGRCSGCNSKEMCSGHGQCLRDGTCDCFSFYGGRDCSLCKPIKRCSGHGTCDVNGTCSCDYGWSSWPNDCSVCNSNQLCSGLGQCNYDLSSYSNKACFCKEGYTERNCSTICPIIDGSVCGSHGDCSKNHSNPFPCDCHGGYHWDDSTMNCVDINECISGSHDCIPPAICINTIGSFHCKCPSLIGWSFDGKRCYDNDECQYGGVCNDHSKCENYPGGYRCKCDSGWQGSGDYPVCKDVNECSDLSHKCPSNAKCANIPGSYNCECDQGYQKVSEFKCVDIDECTRGIHACDVHSTCLNTVGSWNCSCNKGWYPDPASDPRTPRCKDLDECHGNSNSTCPSVSSCVNTAGSYRCECLKGWSNSGPHSCTDVNECLTSPCPANSRCRNTPGSYICD